MNGRDITAEQARSFSATLSAQLKALDGRKLPVVADMLLSLLRDAGAHLGALLAEHDFASACVVEEEREIDELIARVKDEMHAEAQRRIEAAIAPVPPPCLPLRAPSPELMCGTEDGEFRCTAVQGHQPLDHAAWDEDGTLLASWPVTVPFSGLTGPIRRIGDASAPRSCQCPEGDGMIRHQEGTCTDPAVIRLGWYYDPDAVIQLQQATPIPDLPLPAVVNGEVVDRPRCSCGPDDCHGAACPACAPFDECWLAAVPPAAYDGNLCGLLNPAELSRVCTAADGHPEPNHALHGAQGRVITTWPVKAEAPEPDPGHDLNMPHHVGYDDWRSCPPNCPHLFWAVGQGLTGGHAGGPLVTGADPLAVPANRTGGE